MIRLGILWAAVIDQALGIRCPVLWSCSRTYRRCWQ